MSSIAVLPPRSRVRLARHPQPRAALALTLAAILALAAAVAAAQAAAQPATVEIRLSSSNPSERYATVGDVVTVQVVTDIADTVTAATATTPSTAAAPRLTVTIGGEVITLRKVSPTAGPSGTTASFEFTVTATTPEGPVAASYRGFSELAELGRVSVDRTPPAVTVTLATASDSVAAGDNITVTAAAAEEVTAVVFLADTPVPLNRQLSQAGRVAAGDAGALLDNPQALFVDGGYAYVATAAALEIVNISNPANPTPAGIIRHDDPLDDTDGNSRAALDGATAVFVRGDYAYVAAAGALEIVDVSNPANPRHAGAIYHDDTDDDTDGNSRAALAHPQSVFVRGNHAYVASSSPDSLEIVNVSDPTRPTHAGVIYHDDPDDDTDGNSRAALASPSSLFVHGDYAYVASVFARALEIVDISDPANPTHAGAIFHDDPDDDTDGNSGAALASPQSVFVRGDYAYVASSSADSLEIVDVSDPANPTHAGVIFHDDPRDDTDGNSGAALAYPQSVFVRGDYAYVASSLSAALEIVDISDPANPVHADAIFHDDPRDSTDGNSGATLAYPRAVFVRGGHAYLATFGAGDALVNIALGNTYTGAVTASTAHVGDDASALPIAHAFIDRAGNAAVTGNLPPRLARPLPDLLHRGLPGGILHLATPEGTFRDLNEGDTLSYSYTSLPDVSAWLSLDSATGVFQGLPPEDFPGTADITVTVTDGQGKTAADSFQLRLLSAITEIRLDSSNPSERYARAGDTVTVTATASMPVTVLAASEARPSTAMEPRLAVAIGETLIPLRKTRPADGTAAVVTTFEFTVDADTPEGPVTVSHGGFGQLLNPLATVTVDRSGPADTEIILATATATSAGGARVPVTAGDTVAVTVAAGEETRVSLLADGTPVPLTRTLRQAGVVTASLLLNAPAAVAARGDYAYVAANASNALQVVDISDPTAPVLAGRLERAAGPAGSGEDDRERNEIFLAEPVAVQLRGDYAYVAAQGSDALTVIHIADPMNPRQAGVIRHGMGGAAMNLPTSVFVLGNYAYVTAAVSDALAIVDVSDPAKPSHVGAIFHDDPDDPADGNSRAALDGPQAVFVRGHHAYVVSAVSDSLEIVDVSDPANPAHVSALYHDDLDDPADGNSGAALDLPVAVFARGSYAYVLSLASNALQVVDVSDPARPRHAGVIYHDDPDDDRDGNSGAALDTPLGLAVRGDYAYVASLSANALQVVDLSDPTSPRHAGVIVHDDPDDDSDGNSGAELAGPQAVFVHGGHAYVGARDSNALTALALGDSFTGRFTAATAAADAASLVDLPIFTDRAGNRAVGTFNVPPVATALADRQQSANIGEPFRYTANTATAFSDPNGDALSFTPMLAAGDELPAWLTATTDAAGNLAFGGTPPAGSAGTLTVAIVASDGMADGTARAEWTLAINTPPTAAMSLAAQAAVAGQAWTFTLPAGAFADRDGDELTYTYSHGSAPNAASWLGFDAAARTFSGTPGMADAGSVAGGGPVAVTVTVSDGNGGTASARFTVRIDIPNAAPRVGVARLARQVRAGGEPVPLPAGLFTDPEGDPLSYRLGAGADLPDWLTVDADTATLSPPPQGTERMVLSVPVVAADSNGNTAVAMVELEVLENHPPTRFLTPDIGVAYAGLPFELRLPENGFGDGDLDELTYTVTLADGGDPPDWLSFDSATATLRGIPPAGASGVLVLAVTAADGWGGRETVVVGLTLDSAAPVAGMVTFTDMVAILSLPYVTVDLPPPHQASSCLAMTMTADLPDLSSWTLDGDSIVVPDIGCPLDRAAYRVPRLGGSPALLDVPLAEVRDLRDEGGEAPCLSLRFVQDTQGADFSLLEMAAVNCPAP